MPQPTPYDRITNFQNDQALAPTDPYPAPELDSELNAVKITTDEILQNIELIQRDDGELANDSVGFDQLRDEVVIGFDAPEPWETGVDYAVGNTVFSDEGFYYCEVAHTSGVFADDLFVGKWALIADFAQSTEDAQAAAAAAAASAAAAAADADDAQAAAAEATAAQGAFRWTFDSSTVMADPGVGEIRANGSPASSVTTLAISAQTSDPGNPNIRAWLLTWDDSTNTTSRGTIYVRKVSAPENFAVFNLTGTVVDNTTWVQIGVTYITHAGTLGGGEPMTVAFMRTGNQGSGGSGSGDMIAANNLSDVVSVPTSRTNLGLGTGNAPTFSQVTLGNAPTVDMHAATKLYVDGHASASVTRPQWPSILDFDANAGTGSDDTTAFYALVNYVVAKGGGKAYLPAFDSTSTRTYRINATIAPTKPVWFVGGGGGLDIAFAPMAASKLTKILWTGGNSPVFQFTNLNFGCGLEGLSIDCALAAYSAVTINSTCGMVVRNVTVTNFKNYGVLMAATNGTCSWNHFEMVSIQSSYTTGGAALALDALLGVGNVCHCSFVNTRIQHSGTTRGIHIGASDNLSFLMTFIYAEPGATGANVYIDPTILAQFPNGMYFWHLEATGPVGWVQPVGVTVSPGVVFFEQSVAPTLNGTALTYLYNMLLASQTIYNIAGDVRTQALTAAKDVTITGTSPNAVLSLNKAASGGVSAINGMTNGLARWQLRLGDSGTESGSAAGSDFVLFRANDAGTANPTPPLIVNRANGRTTLSGLSVVATGGTLSTTYVLASQQIAHAGFGTVYRPSGDGQYPVVFTNAADAQVGYIQTTASATIYSTSSDARLKTDLKSFDAGHIIDEINVYDFKWRSTGERAYGVVAQEAVDVYPTAVSYMEEHDAWGVDYSKYVPVLLQELKTLRARVAALEPKSELPESKPLEPEPEPPKRTRKARKPKGGK